MLSVGLLLARNLLGAEFPGQFSQRLNLEPSIEKLAEQMGKALFLPDNETSGRFGPALLQLRMRERTRDRFKYCYRLIVSTKLVDSLFMPMGRPR